MTFFAILGDSLRESLDRRGLQVLFGLGLIMVLVFASLSFESKAPEEVLRDHVGDLNVFRLDHPGGGSSTRSIGNAPILVETQRGESPGGAVTLTATIELDDATADELVANWHAFESARRTGEWPPGIDVPATTPEQRSRFLAERLRDQGWSTVTAVPDPSAPHTFDVTLRAAHPQLLVGARQLGLFFGMATLPMPGFSFAEQVILIESGLSNLVVGFVGMLVLLSTCASFVPNMLRKGTVELLLARPVSRTTLLLSKYFGAVLFVLVFSAVVYGLSWLAVGVRSGFWGPGFLAGALATTAIFAVLYSVATLIGVATRSASLATLIALGVWGFSGATATMHVMAARAFDADSWVPRAIDAVYWVLPKTSDLAQIDDRFLASTQPPGARLPQTMAALPDVDWWAAGLTTAAFTAAMLGLALWAFRRRDW